MPYSGFYTLVEFLFYYFNGTDFFPFYLFLFCSVACQSMENIFMYTIFLV